MDDITAIFGTLVYYNISVVTEKLSLYTPSLLKIRHSSQIFAIIRRTAWDVNSIYSHIYIKLLNIYINSLMSPWKDEFHGFINSILILYINIPITLIFIVPTQYEDERRGIYY